MSHSQTESPSARPARRRRRGLVACRRCKSRKQRCDNEFPACSNCLAVGEKCSYGAKQAYPADLAATKFPLSMVDTQSGINEAEAANLNDTATSDLEASVGIVAPSPDYFLGTSSRYPLTKLLRSALPPVDARQTERAVPSHQVNIAARSSVGMRAHTGQQAEGCQVSENSDFLSKEVGDKFIEAYYARVLASGKEPPLIEGDQRPSSLMANRWMIETAMRYCIDNGLHRQATNILPTFDERRKRIFWTAYMLERSVARAMGRPHSISDRDIDFALPANIYVDLDTDEAILAAISKSSQHPSLIATLTPDIHIFRLQQIDSKISYTSLEEWKAAIRQADPENKPHPYLTTDYHMIQYHKAIILLNLPFLPTLTPQRPTFHEIVYSAGQVCSLSKRLHDQQTYISFSLLSLHANFVAGLVMVYCFCLDSSIFSPKFSSSMQACSIMIDS
ncbi:hypothetical protein LB503_005573 [Fusarium chuoi]|nr:hypothetical protein LB503_005573 [Fusarium chuoi]